MSSCRDVRQRLAGLMSLRSEAIPEEIRDHLLRCPNCSGEMAVLRLQRGILTAASDGPTPPAGFAERVHFALSRRAVLRPAADFWRPAWGLVPAFAATAVVLLLLLQAAPAPSVSQTSLFPTEGLSAGEQLVLGASQKPDMDQVLSAVFEKVEP